MSDKSANYNLALPEDSDFNAMTMLAQSEEIEHCREQIETWRELIYSLSLELRDKAQQLQKVEQELQYTNKELAKALMGEPIKFDEAKELAKRILRTEKPAIEALAELLSEIYNTPLKPKELEQINKSSFKNMPLKSANNKDIYDEYKMLKTEFYAFKDKYNELGAKFIEFKATLMRRKQLKENLSYSPPPQQK